MLESSVRAFNKLHDSMCVCRVSTVYAIARSKMIKNSTLRSHSCDQDHVTVTAKRAWGEGMVTEEKIILGTQSKARAGWPKILRLLRLREPISPLSLGCNNGTGVLH